MTASCKSRIHRRHLRAGPTANLLVLLGGLRGVPTRRLQEAVLFLNMHSAWARQASPATTLNLSPLRVVPGLSSGRSMPFPAQVQIEDPGTSWQTQRIAQLSVPQTSSGQAGLQARARSQGARYSPPREDRSRDRHASAVVEVEGTTPSEDRTSPLQVPSLSGKRRHRLPILVYTRLQKPPTTIQK